MLPPALQPLAPAIVGGATQLVEERLSNRLADPDMRDRLVNMFERSYAAFLDVLKGDGLVDGVTVDNGEVTVNFLPLVADGVQQLQRLGLRERRHGSRAHARRRPEEQIAQLEQAFNRDLPDDFGQIVVYRSDSLAAEGRNPPARPAVADRHPACLLPVADRDRRRVRGPVLLARNRLRAGLGLLLGTAATFVVSRVVVNKVLDEIPSVARTAGGQAALAAATQELADGLVKSFGALAVLFFVAAIVVYMLDPESAMRRRMAARTGTRLPCDAIAANRVPVALVVRGGAARAHARRHPRAVADRRRALVALASFALDGRRPTRASNDRRLRRQLDGSVS